MKIKELDNTSIEGLYLEVKNFLSENNVEAIDIIFQTTITGCRAFNTALLIYKDGEQDEIKLTLDEKYNWRLKNRKFDCRYIGNNYKGELMFLFNPYEEYAMTESELKKLLKGSEVPFEAFERMEADEYKTNISC